MKTFDSLEVKPVSHKVAKSVVLANHYMKTFPNGVKLSIGMFDKQTGKIEGICVFGYSGSTEAKVKKILPRIKKSEFLEMQRLWISDNYGHNTESYMLSKIFKLIKEKTDIKVVLTHAGGCKNDCGIVYQASAWLYFGRTKCNDFYLTTGGEYKNMASALRFGRIKPEGRTRHEIGFELFGKGRAIDSYRYTYLYVIDKGIRRRLSKISLPYPKDSDHFRRHQEWV